MPQPTLIKINGIDIALLTVANPVPPGTFDAAFQFNFIWPDAGKVFAAHKAHIIVSALEPATNLGEALGRATAVTLVTGALCDLGAAVGVYWQNAENVLAGAYVIKTAKELGVGERLPVELWVRVYTQDRQIDTSAAPLVAAATRG